LMIAAEKAFVKNPGKVESPSQFYMCIVRISPNLYLFLLPTFY
jgi:hypothetical protein